MLRHHCLGIIYAVKTATNMQKFYAIVVWENEHCITILFVQFLAQRPDEPLEAVVFTNVASDICVFACYTDINYISC